MSGNTTRDISRIQRLLGLSVIALVVGLLPLAAHAAPPPTATKIVLGVPATPSIVVPDTPGAPASYIVRGVDFSVGFTLTDDAGSPLPLSYNRSVALDLTVTSGPDSGRTWTTTVPAGETGGSFTGQFVSAGNGAKLMASSQARKPADRIQSNESAAFDVLKSSSSFTGTQAVTGIGGNGSDGTACDATPEEPVCGDLLLTANMATGPGLASVGACDAGDVCTGQSVQVLVPLAATRTNPATLLMKCDKSACGGGAIKSYTLKVSLVPTAPAAFADPCPSKGTVGELQKFCVDYVQSTRSNAGDTYLYLLFIEDAKVRFP